MKTIRAWFDGACEPRNPGGHASYGAVIRVDGTLVWSDSVYVGHGPAMSNNVAEYSACAAVLRELAGHDGVAEVFGDSKLVVEQLSGNWAVRGGLYLPYYREALAALEPIRSRVRLRWIPREENAEADELSKRALTERGVSITVRRSA